jgi:hypothetical protein
VYEAAEEVDTTMKRSALLLLCAGTLVVPLYARATTAPATPPAPTAATGKSAAVKKNPHRTASAKKSTRQHARHATAPAAAPATPTK